MLRPAHPADSGGTFLAVCRRVLVSLTLADALLFVWYVGFGLVALRGIVGLLKIPRPTIPLAVMAVIAMVSWAAWLVSLFVGRSGSPMSNLAARGSPSDDLWDRQLDG